MMTGRCVGVEWAPGTHTWRATKRAKTSRERRDGTVEVVERRDGGSGRATVALIRASARNGRAQKMHDRST